MKKTLVLLLFAFALHSYAQESNAQISAKNEVSANLLDLVVAGTLQVNYERLFEKNQSLMLSASFFDSFMYYDVSDLKKSSAMTFKLAYTIYFSKEKAHSGFFFYPMLKLRTGDVTIDDYWVYDIDTDTYSSQETTYDVSGVQAGFGIGHKWLFVNKFSLGLSTELGRQFGNSNTVYIDNLEWRFGVNFGYRF